MIKYKYDLKKLATLLETKGVLDNFIQDIFYFRTLCAENYGLEETLYAQQIARESKQEFLNKEVVPQVGVEFAEFLRQLINNGDIESYPVMSKKFLRLLELEKNSDYVEVISAEPLTPVQLKKIEETLNLVNKKNNYLYNTVSAQILGGFVIKRGDHSWDFSLRDDLAKLKDLVIKHN